MKAERFPLRYGALTVAARVASAAKEVALASVFGTSAYKDAFVAAWSAPALIASYGNETMPALLTPVWARGEGGTRGVVAAVAGLQIGLSLIAVAWPRLVLGVVTPGLHGLPLTTAIGLERWLAANIALLGGHNLAAARLNAKRRFATLPAAVGLAALTVLCALAITGTQPPALRITVVAVAVTAGNALGLVVLLGQAMRTRTPGTRPLPEAHGGRVISPPRVLWRSLWYLLAAMAVMNLVPLSERMAASGLRGGSLAAYDYGDRLVQWIFGLTVAPFTAVAFTRLAELRDAAVLARRFEEGLAALLTLAVPLAVVLGVFAPLLTRCVFGWGRFGAGSLAVTAPVVTIRGAGLVLDAALYYALFAILARGGAKAKLVVAAVLATVNAPLAFLLGARDGVAGLAWAHCAGTAAGLGWIGCRRRVYLPRVRLVGAMRAAMQAGAVMLTAALAVRAVLPGSVGDGAAGMLASWAWAALALSASVLGATLLARALTPGLLTELKQELWPAATVAAGVGS